MKDEKKSLSTKLGPPLRVAISTAGALAGIANPVTGGVVGIIGSVFTELYGKIAENKYTDRRLKKLEDYIGDDIELFGEEIRNLNEHDHFSIKRLIKYYCFDAMPEATDISARILIRYILDKDSRKIGDKVIEVICQLFPTELKVLRDIKEVIHLKFDDDYSKVYEWSDFCRYQQNDDNGKETPVRLSSLLMRKIVDENGDRDFSREADITMEAMAYSKLSQMRILNSFHYNYPGMNTDLDIDQFSITPLGIEIMKNIDLDTD